MTNLNKLRSEFEAIKEIQDSIRREQLVFNTKLGCYTKKSGKMCVSANWTNGAWFVFERKAKAQAVPVLTFGYGDIDVMEGIYQGSYALMLGKNGSGVIGKDNQSNRIANDEELHAVFKFHNVKSIQIVIDRLLSLHKRMGYKLPVEIKDVNTGEVIQTIYASESGAEG